MNKFKGLSQSLENEISEKRNYLVISLTILTIVVLTFILLNRTRNLKNKEIKGLRDVRGLRVYSENGNYIGKIDEIYVEQKKSRIYGLLIKLSGKISKDFGSKNVLLKYKHVNSIKNIIIIDKASSYHLENNKYSDEI